MGVILFVFLIYTLWTLYKIASTNSTLRIGVATSVEVAKRRGVFMWEYEADTLYVCDSIPLIVTSAFAQKKCHWKDYESDSIVISDNGFVLCAFDSSSFLDDFYLKGAEHLIVDYDQHYDKGLLPDSLPIYIVELKHHYDKKGKLVVEKNPQGYTLRSDTIQTLYLKRKLNK